MIEGILEFVIFIAMIVVFASIVSYALTLRLKLVKLADLLAQESIEKMALASKLTEIVSEENTKDIEKSDGFIKFLSDSRDSAFKYIEEVQSELKAFIAEAGPVVETHRTSRDNNDHSKKLVESYDRLIKIMPEEPGNS